MNKENFVENKLYKKTIKSFLSSKSSKPINNNGVKTISSPFFEQREYDFVL